MKTNIGELIKPALTLQGLVLWGCELLPQGNRQLLRVYIDKPGGATIDDCAQASRQIGSLLDVEDVFNGPYELEVSTPGMKRPLFTEEQYQQYVDHEVKVQLSVPQDGRKNFKGKLLSVNDGNIELQLETETVTLGLRNIAKGHTLGTS